MVTKTFCRVEFPLGCLVTLGPLPLLFGSHLVADRISWLWMVLATHFVASTAATMLLEAFGTCRLWWYLPQIMAWIRRLPLVRVVDPTKVEKLQDLIALKERMDWMTVPVTQRSWKNDEYAWDHTRTRQRSFWDFAYVNPQSSPAYVITVEKFADGVGIVASCPSGTAINRSLENRAPRPRARLGGGRG